MNLLLKDIHLMLTLDLDHLHGPAATYQKMMVLQCNGEDVVAFLDLIGAIFRCMPWITALAEL